MMVNKTVRFDLFSSHISEQDFQRFSTLIYDSCGIKMPPHKKTMLESRLRKRLRAHGMNSFEEYSTYLFSEQGMKNELVSMIDVVTTNKTDFFREAAHFEFLTKLALPQLVETRRAGLDRPLRVWSAGCSSGEEPYTLAMVLSEFAGSVPGFSFSIMATDISTQVLEKARLGIYPLDKVEPVALELKKKYLLRGKGEQASRVRVVPELRSLVSFRRLNFLDDDFGISEPLDIIFCRNVIIYFDQPTQKKLLSKLAGHLRPGSFIFMGHSETLNGLELPLAQVAPSVYRKN
ncbi:MAG: protein-glutamate O-methyltransferase [Desulfuromonadales bacterium]|nr:protein-glutamate O-methyltransferase [Desulfuromonadales bacterium]